MRPSADLIDGKPMPGAHVDNFCGQGAAFSLKK